MGKQETAIYQHKNKMSSFIQYIFNLEYLTTDTLTQAMAYLSGINWISINTLDLNHNKTIHKYTHLTINYSNCKIIINEYKNSYRIILILLYIPQYKYFTQSFYCRCSWYCRKKRLLLPKVKKDNIISITPIVHPMISITLTAPIEPIPIISYMNHNDLLDISKLYENNKVEGNNNNIMQRNTINTTTLFPMKIKKQMPKNNQSTKGKDFEEIYNNLLKMNKAKVAEKNQFILKNPQIAALFPLKK